VSGFPRAPEGQIYGIDTSASQGRLDVAALKAAGCSFIIAKATDGLHSVDAEWWHTPGACAAAGMPLGAYHVLEPYPSSQASAQAKHFVELLRAAGVPLDLPPMLDFELVHQGAGTADLCTAARIWLDEVESALGREAMVYTGPAFVAALDRYDGWPGPHPDLVRVASRRLVLAHYTGADDRMPHVALPWLDWWIWQRSGNLRRPDGSIMCPNAAQLPGTHVDVDLDVFRGTVDELLGRDLHQRGEPSPAAQRPS
jgi:lysozyme